jgi:hypothetical protein
MHRMRARSGTADSIFITPHAVNCASSWAVSAIVACDAVDGGTVEYAAEVAALLDQEYPSPLRKMCPGSCDTGDPSANHDHVRHDALGR